MTAVLQQCPLCGALPKDGGYSCGTTPGASEDQRTGLCRMREKTYGRPGQVVKRRKLENKTIELSKAGKAREPSGSPCANCGAPATSNPNRWRCNSTCRSGDVSLSHYCRTRRALRDLLEEHKHVPSTCKCTGCRAVNNARKALDRP